MKWGRKSSSPSSHTSLIPRVFPVSWSSKFKQKGGNSETQSANKQQRGKLDFPTPDSSSSLPAGWREARFNLDGDDAYWKLSFRKERTEVRRITGGIKPPWFDSDDEFQVLVSSCKSFGLREMEAPRREEYQSINHMVFENKKIKEKQYKENTSVASEPPNSRRKHRNDRRSRKLRNSAFSNSRKQHNITFQNFTLSTVHEDYAFEAMNGESTNATSERLSNSEWQNLENNRFKEMKVTTVSRRKSACMDKESQSRKIKQNPAKAYCPKTECRIKVIEDKKKAKMKLKKRESKGQVADSSTIFDSFAVVKSSFNPQQDFRDSMVEMIIEKGIRRPEELEQLLACYLTLNSDGYQNLIIKAFQQVWFELSGVVY